MGSFFPRFPVEILTKFVRARVPDGGEIVVLKLELEHGLGGVVGKHDVDHNVRVEARVGLADPVLEPDKLDPFGLQSQRAEC